jgi:hypothetical protein
MPSCHYPASSQPATCGSSGILGASSARRHLQRHTLSVSVSPWPDVAVCSAAEFTALLDSAPCTPQTRASKRKTLVLDLDETLVHSSLDGTGQPHFTFPVGGGLRHTP